MPNCTHYNANVCAFLLHPHLPWCLFIPNFKVQSVIEVMLALKVHVVFSLDRYEFCGQLFLSKSYSMLWFLVLRRAVILLFWNVSFVQCIVLGLNFKIKSIIVQFNKNFYFS